MHGGAVDHVFAGGHDHVHLHPLRLAFSNGAHGPQHRCAAAHVELHHVDLGSPHLEVVTAGIEGEAFAHQGHPTLHFTVGAVDQVNQFGVEIGALADAEKRSHAAGFTLGPFQNGELQAVVAGELGGGLRQGSGCHHIRWSGHQLTGQLHTGAGGIHGLEAGSGRGGQPDQLQGLRLTPWFRCLAEALVGVEGQARSFSRRSGGGGGFQAIPAELQPQAAGVTAGGLGGPGGGAAHPIEVEGIGRPQPQHHQPLGAVVAEAVDQQLLRRLALELLLREGGPQTGEARFEIGGGLILQQSHHQHITVPVLKTGGGEREAHGPARRKR